MGRAVYRMFGTAAALIAVGLLAAGSALAGASITTFTPTEGSVDANGTVVQLTGSGFTGATNVYFNGVPAAWFQVANDATVFARVPAKATSGYITVTAADGSTASTQGLVVTGSQGGQFAILPSWNQPGTNAGLLAGLGSKASSSGSKATISGFSPTRGKAGAKVTIKGSNLKGATAIRFGGVAATSFKVAGSTITVTVPAKAKTGKITVTTGRGTAASPGMFTVTT